MRQNDEKQNRKGSLSSEVRAESDSPSDSPENALDEMDRQEQHERIRNLKKENEKLEKELRVLDLQLSRSQRRKETLQVLAGLGGSVTAFVAIVGLIFSSYQWLQNTEASRQTRIEEQLSSTLRQLGDPSEQQRVYAAVLLRTFLTGSNDKRDSQVLLAYTNGLSVEKNRAVRNAMVSSFGALDEKLVKKELLNHALEDLIQSNRSLIQEGNLWTTHRDDYSKLAPEDTVEARADSVAMAVAIFLRKGAKTKDLSGTYLPNVDFSGLDLTEVSFEKAALSSANFTNGKLYRTRYRDADLRGVLFVSADLRGADFSQSPDNYLIRLVQAGKEISGPNFSCADLREANFSGHPIVPLPSFKRIDKSVFEAVFSREGWLFQGSNLDKTNFSEILVFGGIQGDADPNCPFYFSSLTSVPVHNGQEGVQFFEGELEDEGGKKGSELCTFDLKIFSNNFSGSNWNTAEWPVAIKKWLSENQPGQETGQCTPRATSP